MTCPLGGLAFGSTATIAVVVTPTVAAVITDVASVTATTPDLVPANNVAIEDTTVTDAADLAISKTDSADPVVIGDDVTYTVTVTNPGPSDATGVVVTDTLPGPGSVTFGSATPSQGSCSQASGVVTCPLGLVAVGATATITIVVTTTMRRADRGYRGRRRPRRSTRRS